MSKLISLIFGILFNIFFFVLTTNNVYALDTCPLETNPPKILSTTTTARFTINVGNNTPPGFTTPGATSIWRVEFNCGAPNKVLNGIVIGTDKIYVDVDNRPLECVFSSGPHGITVKTLINGNEVPQCTTSYNVTDSDTQCNLTIAPETGITSATPITVSGTGLNPRSSLNPFGYGLFFNDQLLRSSVDTQGQTTFSGVPIPASNLIPGVHRVNLRYYSFNPGVSIPTVNLPVVGLPVPVGLPAPKLTDYGPPLCSVYFSVGTPTSPGSVITTTSGGKKSNGPIVTGGGGTCDNEPNNPGVRTAIGCVHTSPAGFVKDLMIFLMGISGGLAFLMMLLGAFQMITSAGNPDSLNAGKERMESAIIGLLFVIFSVLLLKIMGVDILGIPGFGK